MTALHLAKLGHHVIATGPQARPSSRSSKRRGRLGRSSTRCCSMSRRPPSIAAAVAEVDALTSGRGLDVLVNNAGLRRARPDVGDRRCRDAAPVRDQRVRPDERHARVPAEDAASAAPAAIINVSSVGGRITLPYFGVYNSTKYAVESLSDALRYELRPFGIDVAMIEPGVIRTNFEATAVREPRARSRARRIEVRSRSTRRCRRWQTGSRRTRS